MPKFLLFLLVNKNNLYTHNQLYIIVLFNIWHYLLGLYKLKKKYLRVKL